MKKHLLITLIAGIVTINATAQQLSGGRQGNLFPLASQSMLSTVCDTIFSFPTLVSWPAGLASDGTNLWLSSYNVPYLSKFSSTGVLLDTLAVPNPQNINTLGGDLDWDGTNLLFSREDDGILYKIDIATKTVIAQIQMPQYSNADPNGFGIAWDGTYLWHTVYSPVNTLYKLDATTGAVLASFPIDGGADLPLKFIGGNLFTIDLSGSTAIQLDTANGNTIKVLPWCLTYPLGFTVHNSHIWGLASDFPDRVYELDSTILGTHFISQATAFDFSINNPVDDKLVVTLENKTHAAAKLNITDVQGRIVLQKSLNVDATREEISVTRFSEGVYFVKLQAGDAVVVKKVIKL